MDGAPLALEVKEHVHFFFGEISKEIVIHLYHSKLSNYRGP